MILICLGLVWLVGIALAGWLQPLPEPRAALLAGILLGVETGIPGGWYSPQGTIPVCA